MFKSINGGILPCRFTKFSAGFDVFANEDVTIGAGETVLVGLGIALDLQFDEWGEPFLINPCTLAEFDAKEPMGEYYLELHPRSSLRAKGLGGGVGIIDIDFIGHEIKMVISNPLTTVRKFYDSSDNICSIEVNTNHKYEIKKGDKIGQLILKRHEGYLMPLEYTKDEERSGGFGSTDKQGEK